MADINMNIHIYEPTAFSDCEPIAKAVVDGTAAVMNVRKMRTDEAQRAIDFLTGVVYALDGTIRKIGHKVLLVSPKNCDVSGQINTTAEEE